MSTPACSTVINEYLKDLGGRFSCHDEDGHLWVVSPFSYPDSDLVEINVGILRSGEVRVSDLGETLRHLSDLGFDPRGTDTGRYLLSEIAKQHEIDLDRGMISKRVPMESIGKAVQEVLTACLSVSHLVFLSRGFRPATFTEEVSQLLAGESVYYETRRVEVGRLTGKKYLIDFYLHGSQKDGLLQALSASTLAASTGKVNATFRLWSDVPNGRWRATLIDDRAFDWRREDVRLLGEVSDIYPWSSSISAFKRDLSQFRTAARLAD